MCLDEISRVYMYVSMHIYIYCFTLIVPSQNNLYRMPSMDEQSRVPFHTLSLFKFLFNALS